MSIAQAFLLGIIYYLGNSSIVAGPVGYYTVYRPLVAGFLTGLILGDPITGTVVGATINLMYIGFISAGGALPGDPCLAGVLGTALAITAGLDTKAALAIAVPIGLIGTLIWFGRMTLDTIFAHLADKYSEEGKTAKVWIADVLLPQAMLFLITAIPCFFAAYFGAGYIQNVINFLGGKVLSILIAIGGMMPALGIAMNLKAIYKGEAKIFFFIGFLITAYFKSVTMISLGFLALCTSIVYMQIKENMLGKQIITSSYDNDDIETMGNKTNKLTKGDVRKSWFYWLFNNQACYNYERMQGVGFLHSMVPVINRLYGSNSDEKKEAMKRHNVFFNSEPCFGSAIVGLTVAMEEKRSEGADLNNDAINSVKSGLMGPTSGIGDTIIQGVLVPLLLAFAVSISVNGNIVGPVLYAIVITAIVLAISYSAFMLGYRKGNHAIMSMLESGVINKVVTGAGIMGCMVLGALVVNYVSLSLGIKIPQSSGEAFSIQKQLFDVICPKILPLLLTIGCVKLMNKGHSSIRIMLYIVALGVIGGLVGIL